MCFLGGTRIPRMPKHLIRGTPADCFGRGRWRLRRGQLAVRRTAGNSGLRLVSRRDPHLAPCDYRLAQPHTTPYISQGRALPFGWRLAFLSLTCQPAGDMEPALLLQSSCIRYFFAKVKGNRIATLNPAITNATAFLPGIWKQTSRWQPAIFSPSKQTTKC